jgi:hypothetical protein
MFWHDQLGYPESIMMRRIIENLYGHPLKNLKILLPSEDPWVTCFQGKLIVKPSPSKVVIESQSFLERIQGDMYGPIHPPYRPFRYFMALIDVSSKWSYFCLLSSQNITLSRLLLTQVPDYPIKKIWLDNAGKFTSQIFDNFCIILELMLNILLHMYMLKMIWKNHL